MSKKDRIAVVASTPVLLFVLLCLIHGNSADIQAAAFGLLLLVCYWGYRFIQNDISFLKIEDDKG